MSCCVSCKPNEFRTLHCFCGSFDIKDFVDMIRFEFFWELVIYSGSKFRDAANLVCAPIIPITRLICPLRALPVLDTVQNTSGNCRYHYNSTTSTAVSRAMNVVNYSIVEYYSCCLQAAVYMPHALSIIFSPAEIERCTLQLSNAASPNPCRSLSIHGIICSSKSMSAMQISMIN